MTSSRRICYFKPTCSSYAEIEVLRTIYEVVHSIEGKGGKSKMARIKQCNNCIHWATPFEKIPKRKKDVKFQCRRYPPTILGESNAVDWPYTGNSWWCGEFRLKDEKI